MKHLSTLLFAILFQFSIIAQTDIADTWNGVIKAPGLDLPIILKFAKNDAQWSGTLDIPLQSIKDMVLADLSYDDEKLLFTLPEVPGNARFVGGLEGPNTIIGDFYQGPMKLALSVTRLSVEETQKKAQSLAEKRILIESVIDSFRNIRHHPAIAVAIVHDGEVLLTKAFGVADIEKNIPADEHTLFAIGSSTKAFTAMGVAMLVDQGNLEWDKPIIHYMPEFKLADPFATTQMTTVDLLCHRSGLPRHDFVWYGSDLSRSGLMKRLPHLEFSKSFRSHWQYQNLMYLTAGVLTERIAGKSWEEFIAEKILNPLGMKTANFSVNNMISDPSAARPYQIKNDSIATRMNYRNLDAIGPAGSINASAIDMSQWLKFLLNKGKLGDNNLISALHFTKLMTPHMPMPSSSNTVLGIDHMSYGLGWMIYQQKSHKIIEHGGNIDGFTSLVWLVPEQNIGISLLTNTNRSGLPPILARTITDILTDQENPINWFELAYPTTKDEDETDKQDEKEEIRFANTTPHYSIAHYVGQYSHDGYGFVEINTLGDSLSFSYNTFNSGLAHWHYEVFNAFIEELDQNVKVHFKDDVNGKVIGLAINLEPIGAEIFFKKLPPSKQTDPTFLNLLVGEYELSGQKVKIKLDKQNNLTATIPGQPMYHLDPYDNNEFKLRGLTGFSVAFMFDDNRATPAGLRFIQPNGVFTAKRVE